LIIDRLKILHSQFVNAGVDRLLPVESLQHVNEQKANLTELLDLLGLRQVVVTCFASFENC